MSDRFEDFIKDHREEFSFREPDPKLWKGIEKGIKPSRKVPWKVYFTRAAMVVFIFAASIVAQRTWLKNNIRVADTKHTHEIEIPELKEAELYYTSLISTKMMEVEPLLSQYPSMRAELDTDLSDLDSVYAGLKDDLKDNIANNEVIEAMIQNYRLRISILEDMLTFLESEDINDTPTNKTGYDL